MNEDFVKGLVGGVIVVAILFFVSVFSGTILFWVLPVVAVFLASNGIHFNLPTWWQTVCTVWTLSILGSCLFKTTVSTNSNKS